VVIDAPAPDLDRLHDPGPDEAGRRAEPIAEAAAQPIASPAGWIRVGTASWTDPTMTVPGVFYPVGADTAEERLQFYAARFPIVEVDATYYALPVRRTSELWVERTPPDFTFDVKAHALMTGQPSEVRRLPKDLREELPAQIAAKTRVYAKDLSPEITDELWARFQDGLEPLREHGQLGSILLQYPRWFFPSSENRALMREARARLDGLRVAVEFRNASWLNEKNGARTLSFLADHDLPLVLVDGPQGFKSSMPAIVAVTSPELAVIRFHGRRTHTWEARGIPTVERFRYLYDEAELQEWVPRIAEVASEARETHVLMNNCFSNYGATNAREIANLLLQAELAKASEEDGEPGVPAAVEVAEPAAEPAASASEGQRA
jgi:uncharacterized protein YecE (DUF72 family)